MTRRGVRDFAVLTTALLACLAGWPAAAQVFRVNAGSTGDQDGESWETAFQTIEQGVAAAQLVGGGEVWVAAGVYDERRGETGTLQMRAGVHLYGGFSGAEVSRAQRNWTLNVTVIDGSVAAEGAPASPVVSGADDSTLDGFIITGGRGANGGGMVNDGASPLVRNCTFTGNRATSFGGGMLNVDEASPLVIATDFVDNRAGDSGGGVANLNANVDFIRCRFERNEARNAGGAVLNLGGTSPNFDQCVFTDNSAAIGGAMFNEDAIVFVGASRFWNNFAEEYGGAVFNLESTPLFENTVMYDNLALIHGGAITNLESIAAIINCTIADNEAEDRGGAVFNNDSEMLMLNSIVWDNLPGPFFNVASRVNVRYSTMQGGFPGTGNLRWPPRFRDAENGDYRLEPFSWSINAGLVEGAPEFDIDGVERPQNGGVDIGAHESTVAGEREPLKLFAACGAAPDAHAKGSASPAGALLLAGVALALFAARFWRASAAAPRRCRARR